VTYRKNKVPKNVSATTMKIPGSISHTHENKGVVATKTAIKGRFVLSFIHILLG
jgi:hypothetical protein